MIGNENINASFMAETDAEESLMLMGRVNALEAVARLMPDSINAESVMAMLGFKDCDDAAVKTANESAEKYRNWYYETLNENQDLKRQIARLEVQVEELMKKLANAKGCTGANAEEKE